MKISPVDLPRSPSEKEFGFENGRPSNPYKVEVVPKFDIIFGLSQINIPMVPQLLLRTIQRAVAAFSSGSGTGSGGPKLEKLIQKFE